MKKIGIIVVLLALIGGGLYYLTSQAPSETIITEVSTEIAALETELAIIQADINAGRLDEAGATTARAALETRLTSINDAVAKSSGLTLTATQQSILTDGLARLKRTLIAYQQDLLTVETKARPRASGSRNQTTLLAQAQEITGEIEETIADIVPDFKPEIRLDLNEVHADTSSNQMPEIVEATPETIDPEIDTTEVATSSEPTEDDDSASLEIDLTAEIEPEA